MDVLIVFRRDASLSVHRQGHLELVMDFNCCAS